MDVGFGANWYSFLIFFPLDISYKNNQFFSFNWAAESVGNRPPALGFWRLAHRRIGALGRVDWWASGQTKKLDRAMLVELRLGQADGSSGGLDLVQLGFGLGRRSEGWACWKGLQEDWAWASQMKMA